MPDKIETIPFKSDLKKLFQDANMYSAYLNFFISHRNIYYRYDDISDLTRDLLEKINNEILFDSKIKSKDER